MKTSPVTITVTNRVSIPLRAIEDYVNFRINHNSMQLPTYSHLLPVSEWLENIDCCSAYVQASGALDIVCANERKGTAKLISSAVETNYLFTCIRNKDGLYKVAWCSSLS